MIYELVKNTKIEFFGGKVIIIIQIKIFKFNVFLYLLIFVLLCEYRNMSNEYTFNFSSFYICAFT